MEPVPYTIANPKPGEPVVIYNLMGNVIHTGSQQSQMFDFRRTELSKGFYIVKSGNHRTVKNSGVIHLSR
ncbi:MAG: T9SS type A sorting domain-containing protein [Fibrobacter sp.]|nr:T9SS type A sorting domain-containing protein [Fibrobacter sp.]